MDDGITIRPLREADAEAVVALYSKAAAVEPRLGPVTLPQWDQFLKLPQNRGGRDFRIAERNGQLIGLAESSLRDQGAQHSRFLKIVVAPEMRRRRIGFALFNDVLAIDAGADLTVQTLVSRDWPAGMAFVSAFDFVHVGSEIGMKCVEPLQPARTLAAARAAIERAGDVTACAAEVARIHNAAYASDAAFRLYSPEEMAQVLTESEVWVASEDGQMSGFCLTESEQNSMWIESVAVDPARQGRGLGQVLVYHVLTAHEVSVEHPCWLNVSSQNAAALKIYRRLGFRPQYETCRFSATRGELIASRDRRFH
ncbi:GNAT family N-acetyltransferase [Bradyrhizobium sp. ISRA443]|uniref:GNAT family N-acetyltransferase n=1 Tax=unclassified Bradyrhizobium TaxID=2631580 RepID=UPI0024789729|nr:MULTISPECIES: GNAT family N-acetyltransferase [unclassified Bradyrhizobium]WGR98844.1 GNAT family N-acetyltransferase [Bradyrhizobium sp. ISRA436]WGS05735.1 GNAT family N-acetyltransferase [Bradyrhizobium sp. ISRA437]WGS12621.1 GNAT family N-acetyltransferase [Bradyrhizobium sp. ISRA443]